MNELLLRVRALEDWKIDIQRKFYGAACVAVFFGITSAAIGTWTGKLYIQTQELESRIRFIDSSTKYWKEQASEALEFLETERNRQVSLMTREFDSRLSGVTREINLVADSKQKELMNLSPQDVISSLQDGSVSLNLRKVSISNSDGVSVLVIGYDDEGGGYLNAHSNDGGVRFSAGVNSTGGGFFSTFNSEGKFISYLGVASNSDLGLLQLLDPNNGKKMLELYGTNSGPVFGVYNPSGGARFNVNISNGRTYSNYFNSKGHRVASLGQFSDSDQAFLRFYNTTNQKTLAEISGSAAGGRVFQFNEEGHQLVYMGPNSASGDGLVKTSTPDGQAHRSLYPIK